MQPVLDKRVLEKAIAKQLKGKAPELIAFVGTQKKKLVDEKMRDNTFAKYPGLKAEFHHLEYYTIALNFIIKGDILQAQATFEKLKSILPVLDNQKEEAGSLAKRFRTSAPKSQRLLLDIVIASSKCLYILAMEVIR